MGVFKSFENNNKFHCEYFSKTMIGPEDMVIVSDNTLIVSSTDRINLDLLHGPSKTE